jgi:hypothetical protein
VSHSRSQTEAYRYLNLFLTILNWLVDELELLEVTGYEVMTALREKWSDFFLLTQLRSDQHFISLVAYTDQAFLALSADTSSGSVRNPPSALSPGRRSMSLGVLSEGIPPLDP